MNTYNSLEEYANHIRQETSAAIGSMCRHMGPEHPAVQRISDLCTEAANMVQAKKMREERSGPGAYDLATLKVHADLPSNSETPFEDE